MLQYFHFLLRLIFVGKASVPYGTLLWQAPALPANVRLGWKIVDVANTLAYYDIATFTVVKNIVQATESISLNLFRINLLAP